jgi:glycerol transport system ATP-binding protein
MSEGEVVQIGTPEALFEHPAHTFVGHFIGSPGMNLLPCAVEGREAALPGGYRIALPRAYPALAGRVELGIRPEFAVVSRDSGLPVTLRRVEDLGRRRIARVELGGVPLAATLPEDVPVPAEPRLALDPARLHIYADGRLAEGGA